MNEVKFLHKNIRKWEEFEKLLEKEYFSNPDKVSDLYIKLTDDLAYARTYFPNTETSKYLNELTQKAHRVIYQNKPTKSNNIIAFWRYQLPKIIYQSRKEIRVSFLIFIISVLIGMLSNQKDPAFVRSVLGDSYVNMTLSNIEKGDPMAVYKQMNESEMFLGISINNMYVSFLAFIFGLFTAFGPAYIMLRNGIMLGTFQGFLVQKGLLLESVATIWIHGTLEIWAIIVAGAAGIIMGNSIVFPGSYKRIESFKRGAGRGIKLIIGLIPIFLTAGFLEGFVTRHTEFSYTLRFGIIGASLIFIIYYYIIYPSKLNKKLNHGKQLH